MKELTSEEITAWWVNHQRQYGQSPFIDKLCRAALASLELKEDAERYQFLRSSADLDCPHVYGPDDDCIIDGDELDAAVDAARQSAQSK